MNGVIGAILPLAVAVTISPLPIIAEVLLLFTGQPVRNAGAYLAGFLVGVAAVLSALVLATSALDLSTSEASSGGAVVQLVLGVLLLIAARRQFRSRPRDGEVAPQPTWMQGIESFTPGRSLAVGAAIGAANPKNVAVGIAAAAVVTSAGVTTTATIIAIVIYVVIAGSGVAAPFVVMAIYREKAHDILDGWKTWLSQNNAAMMTVLFLVFSVVLISRGIAGL
jgi:zinc transporter ZupT